MAEEKKKGWESVSEEEKKRIMDFAEGYIEFINTSKTEREAAREIKRIADGAGFIDLEKAESLNPGDKVYYINHGKSVYMAVIGKEILTGGFNAVGVHIDCPRLDLKQEPLYEDNGLALFKTHYYGGIKKYQWTTVPLSLHGVVAFPDGSTQELCIGEDEADPVFLISDLLPHLAAKQNMKKLNEAIQGEKLNIIVGSIPDEEAEDNKVKKGILKILKEKYGMEEDDFTSAEIEAVPAAKARSLDLTPAWSLVTVRTTESVPIPGSWACWIWERPLKGQQCVSFRTRRRSAVS
ncbi:MAG: hypothetical protein IKD86_00920, partial [Firmicutes bacterium]|nr:hypothetical protein [Bacillota bacterium]